MYNEAYADCAPGGCFDSTLLDARLSSCGHSQAQELLQKTALFEIDLIVVSGLSRSIETALKGFPSEYHHKIVIEPLVAERMEDSCDIGTMPRLLASHFPELDANKFKSLAPLWWYAAEEVRCLCADLVQQLAWEDDINIHKQIDDKIKAICLEHLQNGKREPEENLKERAGAFLKWLQNRPEKRISVIGHSEILAQIIGYTLENCEIHTATIGTLCGHMSCL